MKAVIGVDPRGYYRSALNLLARLRLAGTELTLMTAVESIHPFATLQPSPAVLPTAELMEDLRELGGLRLEEASDYACGLGLLSSSSLAIGGAAMLLMLEAESRGADLIGVGSRPMGPMGAFFLGSVGRALAIGSARSLLVAKGSPPAAGDLTIVFATDHSEYANKCVDKLIEMQPQGIRRIVVATASWMDEATLASKLEPTQHFGQRVNVWIEEKLLSLCEEVAGKFRAAGFESSARVYHEHPNRALSEAVSEAGADLLVIGAQGHGFIERLMVGSVALHQVVAERHSLLILRADLEGLG